MLLLDGMLYGCSSKTTVKKVRKDKIISKSKQSLNNYKSSALVFNTFLIHFSESLHYYCRILIFVLHLWIPMQCTHVRKTLIVLYQPIAFLQFIRCELYCTALFYNDTVSIACFPIELLFLHANYIHSFLNDTFF